MGLEFQQAASQGSMGRGGGSQEAREETQAKAQAGNAEA